MDTALFFKIDSIPYWDRGDYQIIQLSEDYPEGFMYNSEIKKLEGAKLMNMARQLVLPEIKFLFFIQEGTTLPEEVERMVTFMRAEKLIAGVGYELAEEIDEFSEKELFHALLPKIQLSQEEYNKRCKPEGKLRVLDTKKNFGLALEAFDEVGGFWHKQPELFLLEYFIRVQALGYTLLPLKNA